MTQYKIRTAFVFFLVTSLFVPLDMMTQDVHADNTVTSNERIIDEIKSWYFNNIGNSTITVSGNPTLEAGLVGNALDFSGKSGYVAVESKERGISLDYFTLSAWIKPSYTQSPADMTVLDSENAFDLAITTQDKRHAVQFSIFDGLRWISVKSKSEIGTEWTNVVATYNGTAISIYLNGRLDSSTGLSDTQHYYAYGKEVVKIDDSKIKNPVLKSDVYIGGAQNKNDVTKRFSGQIDEVQFYLTPSSLLEGTPKIKAQNDYILNSSSCTYDPRTECSMRLSFHTSEIKDDRVQVTFDHGVVSINGIDYLIKSKDWRGTIPIKGGQATFSGPATSASNDEIRVSVVGNFLDNTMNGHLYRMSGSIKSQNFQTDLFGNFELVSSTNLYEEKIIPAIEKPSPPKILLMTKPFQSAFVKDYFKFDLKVYYSDKNPFRDYYQQGFEVQNATVSLQIVSPTGAILKQFDGSTDNQGYFSGEFIIPPNTAPGVYSIVSSATKGESVDSNSFSLLISEHPIPATSTEVTNPDWPTITLNGTNPQIINKNSPYSELGATASDPEDGDITASIIIDSSSINTAVVGSYTVTYTVTDSSGNVDTETRTVNIVAGGSPVITLTGANPQTVAKNAAYSELGATAADPEDGNISGAIVIDSSAVDTAVVGAHSVTYTVTDSSGNTDTKTRTVNVVIGGSPVITLTGANPQTVNVGAAYSELGATASDPEDGNITASITIDSSSVNTAVIGAYTVTYRVTDSSGNTDTKTRTVNVVDTTPPVIVLNGANPQTIVKDATYSELGATASDNYDGNVTGSITINSSAVNTAIVGTYTITYNVVDSSSNAAIQVTRTVNVILGSPPTITLVGANPQTVNVGAAYSELGATASDPEDGNITASITIDSSSVNTAVIGAYTVTYRVTDSSGDTDTKTRTVNVVDTVVPVISRNGVSPITVGFGSTYTDAGATASDNYDGDITANIVTVNPVNVNIVGTYTITYNVVDSSSNAAIQVTRTVNVIAIVPGAPTGLSATTASASQINLSWTAPADNGGSAITGYKIERESPVGGGWSTLVANTGSTSTTYSNSGLSASTQYNYRVSAINAIGAGSASTAANATTSAAVPGAPTALSATAISSSQINLSWTAPADNGGAAITGYKIERESPVGGGWSTLVADTGSASTTYQNTGLTRATQYNYRVSAINSIGAGSASTAAADTTSSTVPGVPTGLSATAVSSSQINLSWTAPADNGGSAITGYKIERESPVGGGWSTLVANTGSTSTTYSNLGLSASTQYNYRVSAINAIGAGSASTAANATTSTAGPTRLYFSAASASAVNPAFDSWSESDSSARRQMLSAKSASEALALGTRLGWTAGNSQLDRQYVSDPMNAGISFSSTTIKMQLACREFNNGDNSVPRLSAKIVSQDGTTVRQTLLSIANYGTTTEYINNGSLRNAQFANGDVLTGTYATVAGDRLVIEIGHSDSGATPEAQCRYGAPSGTADHGEDTRTTSLVPWVEFSNTITFQAGP